MLNDKEKKDYKTDVLKVELLNLGRWICRSALDFCLNFLIMFEGGVSYEAQRGDVVS